MIMLEVNSKLNLNGVVEVLPDHGNADIAYRARGSRYIARETL